MAAKRVWNPAHHPRDARGRFTKSATRVLKATDAKRAKAAVAGFKPTDMGPGAANGKAWLEKQAAATAAADDAVARYFAGGWKTTHQDLRTKKDAAQDPDVIAIDKAMQPLSDDVMLERRVSLKMFAHIPLEQLKGMKVRDAAYQPTALQGSQGEAPDGMVTIHMAVPAGTRAIINPDTGAIVLDRDTETAISRVEPNGRGGYDLYGIVIPRQGSTKPGRPAGEPTQGDAPDADAPNNAPDAPNSGATPDQGDQNPAGGSAAAGGTTTPPRKRAAAPAGAGDDGETVQDLSPGAKPGARIDREEAARRMFGDREGAQKAAKSTAGTSAPADRRTDAQDAPAPRRTPAGPVNRDELATAASQIGPDEVTRIAGTPNYDLATPAQKRQIIAAAADLDRGTIDQAGKVARNDYIEVTGHEYGPSGELVPVTARGYARQRAYANDANGRDPQWQLYLSDYPDFEGKGRIVVIDGPDHPVKTVPHPTDQPVRLWKFARTGKPSDAGPDPSRPGNIVPDEARAAKALARMVELGGTPPADPQDDGEGPLPTTVDVADLADRSYVRLEGTDQYGAPTTLTGYAGTPNTVTVKKNRRAKTGEQMWAVPMSETPNGAGGWFSVVYTPMDATAEIQPEPAEVARLRGEPPAPATPNLDALAPVDRARLEIAVADEGPGIFQSPLTGRSFSDVGRYIAEGRAMAPVVDKHGLSHTWNAVEEYARAHPELLARTRQEIGDAQADRITKATGHGRRAAAATKSGDYELARREIDAGEMTDPDFRDQFFRGWDEMRAIVARVETKRAAADEAAARISKQISAGLRGREYASAADTVGRPIDPTPDDSTAGTSAPTESKVTDAIAAIGAYPGDLVRLSDLRDRLGDVDRAELDATLLTLARAKKIQLDPDPNRRVMTDRDHESAVDMGGEPMHLVSLPRPADVSPLGEDLDTAPPAAADRLDPAVSNPTRDRWEGHGRPQRVIWFGDGTRPKRRGEYATLTQNGTGRAATVMVRGEGDSELLRRQNIGDRMWIAPVGAPPAPADNGDQGDSTAGTGTPGTAPAAAAAAQANEPTGARIGDRPAGNVDELLANPTVTEDTRYAGTGQRAELLTWDASLSAPRVVRTENIGGREVAIVQYRTLRKPDRDGAAELGYDEQFYAVPADATFRPLALPFATGGGYYEPGKSMAGIAVARMESRYRDPHIASGKTAAAALSGARAKIEKETLRERYAVRARTNIGTHDRAEFDRLDPNAKIEPGDLVVIRSFGKLRTGVATKVTGRKVDALVPTPTGAYDNWYGTAEKGIGVRLLRRQDAPAAADPVPTVDEPSTAGTSAPDAPAAPALTPDEERAAVAGRVFAQSYGAGDVTDDDTRFRMRVARVGARVLDLYGDDGTKLATLSEGQGRVRTGWQVTRVDGETGNADTFPEALKLAREGRAAVLAARAAERRPAFALGDRIEWTDGDGTHTGRVEYAGSTRAGGDLKHEYRVRAETSTPTGPYGRAIPAGSLVELQQTPRMRKVDDSTAGTSAPDAPAAPVVDPAERRERIADSLAGEQAVQIAEAVDTAVDKAAPDDPADARKAALEAKRAELDKAHAELQRIADAPVGGSSRRKSFGVRIDAQLRRAGEARRKVEALEREVKALERPPAPTVPKGGFTPAQLKSARIIKTRVGWHEVVKVNAKSVKVKAAPGMDDLVPIKRIIDARDNDGKRVDAPAGDAPAGDAPETTDQGAPAPSITAGADPFALVGGSSNDPLDDALGTPPAPASTAGTSAPAVDVDAVQVDDEVRVAGQWATVTAKVGEQLRVRFPGDRLALVAPGDVRQHRPAVRVDDMFGGSTTFVPQDRATIGVAARADVGRTRGAAAVQQVSMFDVADQVQHPDQGALLDAFLQMPTAEAPISVPELPADAPEPTRVDVPEDLTGWTDEQLSGLFAEVSAQAEYDEPGTLRILGEWERRESEMQAALAMVPEDLTALEHDQVADLFALVTSHHGTMDSDQVARLEADLDRRDREHVAALADLEAKRALVDMPVEQHADDDALVAALNAAGDLGDEDATLRILDEIDRRDQEQRAQETAAAAEAHAREAAEAQARVQAEAAAAAAANARELDAPAEARMIVLEDLIAQADDAEDAANSQANRDAPAEPGMADVSQSDLYATVIQKLGTPEADAARREIQRREAAQARSQQTLENRRARRRMLNRDLTDLTEDELVSLTALLDTLPGEDGAAFREQKLADLRDETNRRQRLLDDKAARRANGPDRNYRRADPVSDYIEVDYALSHHGKDAARWGEAKELALGLQRKPYAHSPGSLQPVPYKEVKKAVQADPRPWPEIAQSTLAWYRHLSEIDDPDFAGNEGRARDFSTHYGFPSQADAPELLDPIAPADVAKADMVLYEMYRTAFGTHRNQQGDESTAIRYVLAQARAYRIPHNRNASLAELNESGVSKKAGEAYSRDPRSPQRAAADVIAEFRRLAAEDGVDPADTERFGPADRKSSARRAAKGQLTSDQQARIQAHLARGLTWEQAYAEAIGVDEAELRRQQADDLIRSAFASHTRDITKAYKQAYTEHVMAAYQAAEDGTAGHLLNDAGKQLQAKGKLSAIELFSGSSTRAYKYASEELKRWWGEHPPPRLTFAEWQASMRGDPSAMAAAIQKAKGNEFA